MNWELGSTMSKKFMSLLLMSRNERSKSMPNALSKLKSGKMMDCGSGMVIDAVGAASTGGSEGG